MALSDIQQFCKMGRACRICDRKFFLRTSYQGYATLLTHYFDNMKEIEQNFNIVKMDLNGIEQEGALIDE